jgi:hypothetical protein
MAMTTRASSVSTMTIDRQQQLMKVLSNPPGELDCTSIHTALRTIFQTYDTKAAKENYKRHCKLFEKQAVREKVPLVQREAYVRDHLVTQLGAPAVAYRRVHLQICETNFDERARNIFRKKHEEKRSTLELTRDHLQATVGSLDENAKRRICMVYKEMILTGFPISEVVLNATVPLPQEQETRVVVATRRAARSVLAPTSIRIFQRFGERTPSPTLLQFLVGQHCIATCSFLHAPSQLREYLEALARLRLSTQNAESSLPRIADKRISEPDKRDSEDKPSDELADFVLVDLPVEERVVVTTIQLPPSTGQKLQGLLPTAASTGLDEDDFVEL